MSHEELLRLASLVVPISLVPRIYDAADTRVRLRLLSPILSRSITDSHLTVPLSEIFLCYVFSYELCRFVVATVPF